MKASGNQVVLPLNIAVMIDPNDPVFKMAKILGELDYRKLRSSYRRKWRKLTPEVLFSIAVYASQCQQIQLRMEERSGKEPKETDP